MRKTREQYLDMYESWTIDQLDSATSIKTCGDCLRWLSNRCPYENTRPSMYDSACKHFTANVEYNAAREVLAMKKLESL